MICLVVLLLAFIFSCMPNVLPIGRYIVGTFGIMTYPLLLIASLISLATFMGFSYSRRLKPTLYFSFALAGVLLTIHAIATFSKLNLVIDGKTLGAYLSQSYTESITLTGSVGSLFCGLLSMLLGAMGVIVVCVIVATLFIGLYVDYQIYGKYEEPHVKKLKTRALREKVQRSDKKRTEEGAPAYSFDAENDAVVDEISVDESEIDTYGTIYDQPRYSDEDIVAETSSDEYSNYDYSSNSVSGAYNEQEIQTQNEFSNEFYKSESYPSVYDEDSNEDRRRFMSDTFGGYSVTNTQTEEVEPSYDDSNYASSYSDLNDASSYSGESYEDSSYGAYDTQELSKPDDYDKISQILSISEDDVEGSVQADSSYNSVYDSYEPETEDLSAYNQYNQKPVQTFETKAYNPAPKMDNYSSNVSVNDYDTLVQRNTGFNTYDRMPANSNSFGGFASQLSQANTVAAPKPVKPNAYAFNTGMPGIRYNPPPLSLLRAPKPDTGDYTAEQQRKSTQLEQVLAAFNIPAKVKNIVRGPKITRYELSVPLGVSVKKIPQYENDIAAALAAKTIVIKAPIPGSPYVGIELENDTFTTVYQRELFESDAFQNCKDPLPIAIGKDISGEIIVKSMAKMVHLLIAGSTGSGKSVFIHNIVLSLIYKSSPDDLRLIMIDPKKVEFNRYNGLPHLLTPEVVMGADKAMNAFRWCVKEMERRYDLMSKAGYNNIEPYNKSELVKAGQFEKFPYIVIIVDELAEIMAVNKKEVELCIQRLTQLARACGMHLILATQRPSVDIISGVIKNNVPSRIAFSLQSGIDSKTILNSVGAEKLLGQGDMIFAPTGTASTPRLQASYASDEEIKAIIDYDKKYNTATFDESIDKVINAEQPQTVDEVGGFADAPAPREAADAYLKTAVKLVMANGGASVSYLQRRLSIGYARAARIIDQMEDKGYIAQATGSKQRSVLITPDQFREEFGEDFDSID